MVITLRDTKKLKFPVYRIFSSDWEVADGLLFIEGQVADDRNMPGETLGIRRVQTPYKELYPLKKQINDLNGILKQPTNMFIDSAGRPFIYEKTKLCKLSYYRIRKIDRKETASVLWLKGITAPFIIPRPPEDGMQWAGILHYHGLPWILYEYSESKKPDTRRKA